MASATGLFLGQDRKLRPFWRAAIFYLLVFWVLPYVTRPLSVFAFRALHLKPSLSAALIAFAETRSFLIVLIPTAFFAWYEHRRIDSYGLSIGYALRRPTWEGVAAGIVMAGAVAIGMLALGGMQIHGLALAGTALLYSMLAWLGANICVGISEEFWFRSYFLQTLWKSVGFWPASIIVAAVFAAIHYFNKPGENLWDVITLVSLSMMMCYSVLRTGTLWFAAGFHIAFDFMQLVVIGTPNGGQIPQGRLFDVTFNGPAWLTGGSLGTEASFLMYPMIALIWLYLWWRFPRADGANAAVKSPA